MDKVKYVLRIWSKLSNHVRFRDRSVKVLQYSCQMLLGFYGSKFSKEVVEGLKHTRTMTSSARKAFWLLKSFNHVGTVISMMETYSHANDECYATLLDILEQLFLILYYFYENLVFLSRTKLVGVSEDMIDDWGNWSWFMGDLVCFVAATMRMYINCKNYARCAASSLTCEGSTGISVTHNQREYPLVGDGKEEDLRLLKTLRAKVLDSVLSVSITGLELGASAESVDLFRTAFGTPIGDAGMGICGVVSSALILLEYTLAAVRAEPDPVVDNPATAAIRDGNAASGGPGSPNSADKVHGAAVQCKSE